MKRVLLILSMVLPLCLFGQNNEAKYLAGAVPVENGFVTFKKDFTQLLLRTHSKMFTVPITLVS